MKTVLFFSSILCFCIRLSSQNINYDNLASVNPTLYSVYNSGASFDGQYYSGISPQNVYSSSGIGNTENGYGYLSNNKNEKDLSKNTYNPSLMMSISASQNLPPDYMSSSSNLNVGCASLGLNTTGTLNTAIGHYALSNNTTGNSNTALGYLSQGTNTTGVGNTTIGYESDVSSNSLINATAIGFGAIAMSSNEMRLGNGSVTSLYCKGAANAMFSGTLQPLYVDMVTGQIGYTISSSRYKENITDLEINTSKLYDLRTVSYNYKKGENNREAGLIAEEVDKVLPYLVVYRKEKDVIQGSTSDELIPESVHYDRLPVLILNELQKHEKKINSIINENQQLKKENEQYKEKINQLEKRISDIEMILQKNKTK